MLTLENGDQKDPRNGNCAIHIAAQNNHGVRIPNPATARSEQQAAV